MPGDDRSTKTAERCHVHPGAVAVAHCTHCDRPVCISCAVPVRGAVVGAECLSAELGSPWSPPAPGGRTALAAAGFAILVALVATALPWTRLGRWLGGWTLAPDDGLPWADLATAAAVVGCVLWLVARRRDEIRPLALAIAAAGAVLAVSAYLAIANPPPFTRAWLGPYLATPAGGVALVAGAVAGHRARTMS